MGVLGLTNDRWRLIIHATFEFYRRHRGPVYVQHYPLLALNCVFIYQFPLSGLLYLFYINVVWRVFSAPGRIRFESTWHKGKITCRGLIWTRKRMISYNCKLKYT